MSAAWEAGGVHKEDMPSHIFVDIIIRKQYYIISAVLCAVSKGQYIKPKGLKTKL